MGKGKKKEPNSLKLSSTPSKQNVKQQTQGSEVPRSLSSSVQKLRFMRMAEHEAEQQELRLKQKLESEGLQWCAEGWEERVKNELKILKRKCMSSPSSTIYVQARRSYNGVNKGIESAMETISRRIEKFGQEQLTL